MNGKYLITGAAVALLTVACGPSIRTATDYDHSVRFADYHSFYIMKGNPSGNPLMDQRAQADVERALVSKGWMQVPEGQGEAAVAIHAATKTKHTYETLYDGWGGGGWGWRRGWGGGFGGGSTTFVNDYKVGTLMVDVFDAKTKQAIWHGSATDALSKNPKSNATTTEEAIDKMFSSFPPTSMAATGQ